MTEQRQAIALITGASSGIGLELARIFAAEGYELIMCSHDSVKLANAANEVAAAEDGASIHTISVDLSLREGAEKLHQAVDKLGKRVDVLVNNAGIGVWGDFSRQTGLSEELAMIQLNIASVVAVTKLFVRDMIVQGSGKILLTSSEAALSPIAYMSVYAASKAFIYSFALSLREELMDTGITVTALLPGATRTSFFRRAGMERSRFVQGARMADPAKVARDGYHALMSGDDHIVTPFKEKLLTSLAKVLPDRMAVQRMR